MKDCQHQMLPLQQITHCAAVITTTRPSLVQQKVNGTTSRAVAQSRVGASNSNCHQRYVTFYIRTICWHFGFARGCGKMWGCVPSLLLIRVKVQLPVAQHGWGWQAIVYHCNCATLSKYAIKYIYIST